MNNLQSYYDEHAAQARQHESQREALANIILGIAGALIGLMTFAELSLWSLPAGIALIAIGAYGWLFAGKHYERFRFHTAIMSAVRHEMDRVADNPGETAETTSALRSQGETKHYANFTWPQFRGSRSDAQASAKSWIARQRLHVFWEGIPLLVATLGVGMSIAVAANAIRSDDKAPLQVEIVGDAR